MTTTTTAMTTTTSTTSGDISDEYDYGDYDYVEMTLPVQIPTGIGLVLLIVFAISGNAMTIAAYVTDKTRKSVYDFVIFHLAVTDLLISSISMPFYAVYTLMEFTWPFGYTFCKIWLAADFTFCFESILLMLLLSLDRLLLLTFGSHYSIRMTLNIAKIQVIITWVVSFLVYGPAILAWNYWVGYSTVEENDCDVEFAFDFSFTASTSILEFVLPFICLSSMNAVIYLKIRRRHKSVWATAPNIPSTATRSDVNVTSQVPTSNGNSRSIASCSFHEGALSWYQKGHESEINQPKDNKIDKNQADSNTGSNPAASKKSQSKKAETNQSQIQAKREIKAARLLAILVVAFLVLWAPYTVTTMVIAFCGDKCLNISLYEFFNWVLWMKSAVNPLLYALNTSFYRRHFIRYLRCNGRIPFRRSRVAPT